MTDFERRPPIKVIQEDIYIGLVSGSVDESIPGTVVFGQALLSREHWNPDLPTVLWDNHDLVIWEDAWLERVEAQVMTEVAITLEKPRFQYAKRTPEQGNGSSDLMRDVLERFKRLPIPDPDAGSRLRASPKLTPWLPRCDPNRHRIEPDPEAPYRTDPLIGPAVDLFRSAPLAGKDEDRPDGYPGPLTVRGFSMWAKEAFGIANPGQRAVMPLTKEQGQQLLDEAKAAGMSVEDYVESL